MVLNNQRVTRQKRDVPPPQEAEVSPPTSGSDVSSTTVAHADQVLIIAIAASAAVLLVIALVAFMICLKRRRAARRVGQQQEVIPTFMDEKSTEEYFKNQTKPVPSAPTFPTPSKTHHRTRSVPVILSRGEPKDQEGGIGTEGVDQFHQIPLNEGEGEAKGETGFLARGLSRFRASTVASPTTTLHRSVSLNSHHGHSVSMGRSAPIDEEVTQDPSDKDALPTATNLRFSGQRKHSLSKEYSNPSRFNASMSYHTHRKSTSSVVESDTVQCTSPTAAAPSPMESDLAHSTSAPFAVESDPARFTSTSAEVDPKKPSIRPSAESSDESDDDDDTASTVSSDEFDHLPPHQRYQNFDTHNPYRQESDELQDIPSHLPSDSSYDQAITHNPSPMASRSRMSQGIAFMSFAPLQPSRVTRSNQEQNQHNASDTVDAETP